MSGQPETKSLKEMMPDILKQVGPQQYQFLKQQIDAGTEGAAKDDDDDDDDVPDLVGTFEDAGKWAVSELNRVNKECASIDETWTLLMAHKFRN